MAAIKRGYGAFLPLFVRCWRWQNNGAVTVEQR
jgi:hypothetical protein